MLLQGSATDDASYGLRRTGTAWARPGADGVAQIAVRERVAWTCSLSSRARSTKLAEAALADHQ